MKLVLILIGLLLLTSGMSHETILPSGVNPAEAVFTETTMGKQMKIVLTKAELNIYKINLEGSY